MPFKVGEEVGFYRVLEQIGQGGMATVFKASHSVLDRYVALKVMNRAFLEDSDFMTRFKREARVVAGLDHPNIVPIYEFAEHNGLPYLVMKLIEGETLRERLLRGPISRQECCDVMEAVGRGLSYAHDQGILHRDIKPSNIMLGNDGSILLTDFGLARVVEVGESTLSHEVMMGTPQYISPEQVRSEPDLDERTDIYSFGVILYELLVGIVPFDSESPFSVIRDHLYTDPPLPSAQTSSVSERLERVILQSMAKERDERFSSVNEMITAFQQALEEGESEVEQDQEAAGEVGLPALVKENIASIHQASLDQEGEVEGDKELRLPTSLITANGISFPLIGERLLIGREDPNHGFSPDIDLTEAEPVDKKTGKHRRTVHREQAWIYQTDKGWWVEVIPGKEKRAWFEGEPMEPGRSYLLHAGDKLKFGAVDLVVEH